MGMWYSDCAELKFGEFDPCIAGCYGRYIDFSVSTKTHSVVAYACYSTVSIA
jgi:hypothetical protein